MNTRPQGRVFKRLPRNPANVNVMKQTYMIPVIGTLAFYLISVDNRTKNVGKSLELYFVRCISLYKIASDAKLNVKDVISANNVNVNKSTDKMLISGRNILPRNVKQTILRPS